MSFAPPFDLLPPLLVGLGKTLQLTAGGILLCVLLALFAGLGKVSGIPPLRWLANIYVEIFRGTSALVQLFWFFFVLPFFGVSLEPMLAGILVLGLNSGAYGAEVVRGAIQAVSHGQKEAATALGFTPRQTLWRILLPQAVVSMLPPMSNVFIELLKNSALVSVISVHDLTFVAQIHRADSLRTTAIFSIVLVLYFAVAQGLSRGMSFLEKRLSRGRDLGGVKA
ncbi:MAG: ectoine/hydroxyectoine ABC transporter permease subunit EhuC [Verrucomicrobia bacterium]|nr:ectoine/hydroxyectoine ABC transporter permease subunit EhuC [Verrucomicrobiota bacterium]MCH8512661.1 ectoine/hydroxyectoine ABC transporter permease subunit EhuC [Kiritimatiellia bacterium]